MGASGATSGPLEVSVGLGPGRVPLWKCPWGCGRRHALGVVPPSRPLTRGKAGRVVAGVLSSIPKSDSSTLHRPAPTPHMSLRDRGLTALTSQARVCGSAVHAYRPTHARARALQLAPPPSATSLGGTQILMSHQRTVGSGRARHCRWLRVNMLRLRMHGAKARGPLWLWIL